MDDDLKIFFTNICDNLKNSSGSVDIIVTTGTSVLLERSDDWISYGISNLSEIHAAIKDIMDILREYEPDDSSRELPVDDLFAVLQDLAYHSAVFGVYFFAIESIFEEKIIDLNSPKTDKESRGTLEIRVAIPKCDSGDTDNSKNTGRFENIALEANKAYVAFDVVFSKDIENYPHKLSCLYELQRSLLSLQTIFIDFKKRWWTNENAENNEQGDKPRT